MTAGLILYESTQLTAHDENDLASILRKIRFLQFPDAFLENTEENVLIKQMLSHSPESRPNAEDVLRKIKKVLTRERKSNCRSIA